MKKLILIALCVITILSANAQRESFEFPLKSANQQLVEDAVTDGFFIVHTQYRLKDKKGKDPQYYGWEGKPYFGETVSLGIKTHGGFILSSLAVKPWLTDRRFDEYRDDNRYEPIVYKICYTAVSDTATAVLPVTNTESLAGGSFYLSTDTVFHHQGFPTDYSDGVKNGWLVWIVAPEAADSSESILVYRNETEFRKEHNVYSVKSPSQAVLGGVFIVPRIEGVGKITFYIGGLAVENDGQWQIVRIGSSNNKTPAKTEKEKPKEEKAGGLTPIK
jgi:hypothetical protein